MNSLAKSLALLLAGFAAGAGAMLLVPRGGEAPKSTEPDRVAGPIGASSEAASHSSMRDAFAAIARADDDSIDANYWTLMTRRYAMIPWISYGGEHVWGGGLRLRESKEHTHRWEVELDLSNQRELVGDRARVFIVGDGVAREVSLEGSERNDGSLLIVTPSCVRVIDLAEGSISQLGGEIELPPDAYKKIWTKAKIDPAVLKR